MAQSITVTINEVAAMFRAAGMKVSPVTLADGIEAGVYPFGRLVKKSSAAGRRQFEIFRVDVQRFLESKTPKEESA